MEDNLKIIESTGALNHLRTKDKEMLKKSGNKLGARVCGILRHEPDLIGLAMDLQGWVSVDELMEKFNAYYKEKKYYLTLPVLMELVRTDNKQRYGLKGQLPHLMIRCRQGHSIPWLEMDYRVETPPATLYHGTISAFYNAIMSEGLRPMGRQKVHLSADIPTALKVAGRRKNQGMPIILWVNAKQMAKDGVVFYLSDNGVWLTDYVAPKYLTLRNIPLK